MANPKPDAESNLRRVALTVVLGIGFALVAASLLGYDPADPQSGLVYPANETVQNWCGPAGAVVAASLVECFGIGSIWLCVAGLTLTVRFAFGGRRSQLAWCAVGFGLLLPTTVTLAERFRDITFLPSAVGPGGLTGALLDHLLVASISRTGSLILLAPLFVVGMLLAFDRVLLVAARVCVAAGNGCWWVARRFQPQWLVRQPKTDVAGEPLPTVLGIDVPGVEPSESAGAALLAEGREHPQQELRIVRNGFDARNPGSVEAAAANSRAEIKAPSEFRLPDVELLDEQIPFDYEDHEQDIRERALLLEQTFATFNMTVKVVQIDTGPVVTLYEISLEPGLRAHKVKGLADDLAIAMRAQNVRIVAPMPGKNTVGIEVPNERRATVCLKEVMKLASDEVDKMRLPLYLGKDVKGQPLICDLANMPHLLIAGRTGTGKSVCLNALILSVLMTRTPDQVKMLMIDPKMVELSLYKNIPHLMHPVVTDMKKAEALLAWAVDKMEERYELLARAGVRHIGSYNALSRAEIDARLQPADETERAMIPDQMPYIIIFADEMADLMMTAAKEVEAHIIRLAQKSRAVGIHLILATQKPTVDVITGLIKSNLPARIAFQVASRSDSRVVLDEMGADKLLGNGDMLFLYPGTSKISRAQGTFIGDNEIGRVTAHLASQGGPQYSKELIQLQAAGAKKEGGELDSLADRDELYEQAIDVIVREQRGSVSLLQRSLGIGYGRGARLIDYMAEDGIVGEYNGSQAREVLYSPEEWQKFKQDSFGKAG